MYIKEDFNGQFENKFVTRSINKFLEKNVEEDSNWKIVENDSVKKYVIVYKPLNLQMTVLAYMPFKYVVNKPSVVSL